MMNPTSNRIPSSDPRIAFSTSPAGPSVSIALEMNPIAQSEARYCLVLVQVLARDVTRKILPFGELVTQSAAISVSGNPADLVNLREVFCSYRVKHVAREITGKRKPNLAPAGRLPGHGCTGEAGARPSHRQRPGPVPGQVNSLICRERQNMRAVIPIPMLLV